MSIFRKCFECLYLESLLNNKWCSGWDLNSNSKNDDPIKNSKSIFVPFFYIKSLFWIFTSN